MVAHSRRAFNEIKRSIPMGRTVVTAALLAAFAIPEFDDDAAMKKEDATATTQASASGEVSKERSSTPLYLGHGRSDCMQHRDSAMKMM